MKLIDVFKSIEIFFLSLKFLFAQDHLRPKKLRHKAAILKFSRVALTRITLEMKFLLSHRDLSQKKAKLFVDA